MGYAMLPLCIFAALDLVVPRYVVIHRIATLGYKYLDVVLQRDFQTGCHAPWT